MLALVGDGLCFAFVLPRQTTPEFKNSPLTSITDDIVKASSFLKELGDPQLKCVEAFSKCGMLVEWLRDEVKGQSHS